MKVDPKPKITPLTEADSTGSEIAYRLATTQDELEQAFALVRNAYIRVGLHAKAKPGLRVTKYHLLPQAKVFVAIARRPLTNGETEKKVIGTITVVPDGALGLPAEEVAGREIDKLRLAGRRAAEFIALAADDEGTRQRVVLKLFRLAYEYCRFAGVHTIYATLTERHIGFYQRFLGFKPLGELAPYQLGNNMPVQVHYLDVSIHHGRVEHRSRALDRDPAWRHFWHTELYDVLKQAQVARPWTARLIAKCVGKSQDLAQQLDARSVALLEAEYRRYGQSLGHI